MKREYPIPEYGPHGLIPKFNPEVWNPRDVDRRKERYGEPILLGKKDKAPNFDAPAPAPAAPAAAAPKPAAPLPPAAPEAEKK